MLADDYVRYYDELLCPLGLLGMKASEKGLSSISLITDKNYEPPSRRPNSHIEQTKKELGEYFAGRRVKFEVSIDLLEGTAFQRRVWKKLMEIEYGKTQSYAHLAESLGDPKCIRAAAAANGRNPIPIIIPCHRIIGKDNSLVGYALGVEKKRWLLTLENPRRFGIVQGVFDF
jgi:methylated-DNA-[protein]-cysteine S-methyltransferase